MAGNSSKTGKIQRDPPSIFLPSVSLSLFVRVRAIKRPRKATIDRGTIAGSRWLIAITITCTLWLLIKSWPTSNLADTHSRSIFEKEREEGERERERERKKGKDRLTEETRVGWNLIPEGVPSLDICQSVVGSINKLIAYTCRLLVHRRHASRFSTDSLFFSLSILFSRREIIGNSAEIPGSI